MKRNVKGCDLRCRLVELHGAVTGSVTARLLAGGRRGGRALATIEAELRGRHSQAGRGNEWDVPKPVWYLRQHLHILVEKLRCEVGAVFPDNGVDFWIDRELLDCLLVPEGAEDVALKFVTEVDFALGAVVELQPQHVVVQVFRVYDV